MTSGLRLGGRQFGAPVLLAALVGVVALVALVTPESAPKGAGSESSHSTGPAGARMAYELAQRMGWVASRRESPLASVDGRSVQVVLSPQQMLGAAETHLLLENVRRGGGLIFDIRGGKEIADSIGIMGGQVTGLLSKYDDTGCAQEDAGSLIARSATVIPPTIRQLRWRRPPPGVVTPIILSRFNQRGLEVGSGFPMGAGRVVVMGSADVFDNIAVRICSWAADVAVARAFEFVRPAGVEHPAMVFDEFHHGFGAHDGSVQAVAAYLAHTASGHFLEQALLAALVLLLASAPRAIAPRDPERAARRSPLEHADALAHAYADVRATRTATSRLVSGVRRRVGRTVAVPSAASEADFLDGVVRRTPTLRASVDVVRRGLSETLTPRQFAAVAGAVLDIEHQLSTTPPTSS